MPTSLSLFCRVIQSCSSDMRFGTLHVKKTRWQTSGKACRSLCLLMPLGSAGWTATVTWKTNTEIKCSLFKNPIHSFRHCRQVTLPAGGQSRQRTARFRVKMSSMLVKWDLISLHTFVIFSFLSLTLPPAQALTNECPPNRGPSISCKKQGTIGR